MGICVFIFEKPTGWMPKSDCKITPQLLLNHLGSGCWRLVSNARWNRSQRAL